MPNSGDQTLRLAGFEEPDCGPTRALSLAPTAHSGIGANAFAVTCLLIVAAFAFARWPLAGVVVPWDSKNHFYPTFRLLGDTLRHGTMPLWNPFVFSGYPAVADPQSLIFAPTMVALAFAFPHASMEVFDGFVALHVLLGGLGMMALGRRWSWTTPAALLAALVFMFGGSAAARLQHTGMILSYSFFPAALWLLITALDRSSWLLAIGAGLVAAFMALGRDQVALLLCLTLAVTALRHVFRSRASVAPRWRQAGILLAAGCTTVLLLIVPALLTLQFLRESNRPGIPFGMAVEGSLDPANLLTLGVPNVFGSLDRLYDYWGPGAATPAGNDWTDRSINYLFAGSLPFVLVAWFGVVRGWLLRPGCRFFSGLFAFALLYAVGRYTPFFTAAFNFVPGVDFYRRPADATFIVNVALAFLSGELLTRFTRDGNSFPQRSRSLFFLAGCLIAGATVVGLALNFARHDGHLAMALARCAEAGAILATSVLVMNVSRSPRWRSIFAVCLVGLTAGELVWLNAASPLNAEPRSTYSAYSGLYPDQARGLAVLRRELAASQQRGEKPRVEILGIDGSWQNASMILGLENTLGYNPLRLDEYERAVGVAESSVDPALRTFPDSFRGYNSLLATRLGLDYLVIGRPITDLPRHFPRAKADLLFAGDHFYVYRLNHMPVPRALVVSGEAANAAIAAGVHPTASGSQGQDKLPDSNAFPTSDVVTPITLTDTGDSVRADVTSDGGVFVLHDLAYPGWVATVDDRPVPIMRVDGLFRGVRLLPGHHRVEFAFHPFGRANLVSALTFLLSH